MMIYNKITEIMKEIIPLGKIKREDIVPTLLPLLAKYNITIRPAKISEFQYSKNETSFIAEYELVDTEITGNANDSLSSIQVQIPAGGTDAEKKGRATYMACTGAYRQVLQQIFAIPIIEETNIVNLSENDSVESGEQSPIVENEFAMEFADDNQDTQVPQNNVQNSINKPIQEFTEADLEEQFKNF